MPRSSATQHITFELTKWLRLATHLPDPLVRLVPAPGGDVDRLAQELPLRRIELRRAVVPGVDGVEEVPVDVELDLGGRAVADPHRPRAAPALEVELDLGQPTLAVGAVHDQQIVGVAGRGADEEAVEPVGDLGVVGPGQRIEHQRRVAHPRVAVVPVARPPSCSGSDVVAAAITAPVGAQVSPFRTRTEVTASPRRCRASRRQRDHRCHHSIVVRNRSSASSTVTVDGAARPGGPRGVSRNRHVVPALTSIRPTRVPRGSSSSGASVWMISASDPPTAVYSCSCTWRISGTVNRSRTGARGRRRRRRCPRCRRRHGPVRGGAPPPRPVASPSPRSTARSRCRW